MTTSIITDLLGPICELFYKYQSSLQIKDYTINTLRNYGFSTISSLNYGFELNLPFDLNNIQLQPGVLTSSSVYNVYPNLSSNFVIDVNNLIEIQDLPASGIGTVRYVDRTLPIKISLTQNANTLVGIASAFQTNGIPIENYYQLNTEITRAFESEYVNDSSLSGLVFVNMEDVYLQGTKTNWVALPSSLYNTDIESFRVDNGYGQYYSFQANQAFLNPNILNATGITTGLYNSTYENVYNWKNYLTWEPDFQSWYDLNKETLPVFLRQFLQDYFGLN